MARGNDLAHGRGVRATVCAVACALLATATSAAERALHFQVVSHTTDVHALPLGEMFDRELGVAAFRGLAIFDDGRIANHWYGGHYDFAHRNGPIAGHALWVFDDGSTLRAAYRGEAAASGDAGITFTARYTDVTGTGAWQGVKGTGRFEGKRVDHLQDGGDTWFKGVLDLTVPDQQ